MIHIGYQRITPTPTHPAGIASTALAGYAWSSQGKVVIQFKKYLKTRLREIQQGRCCFCRRPLGDPSDVDIEHFLERAAVPNLTFEITNLALSCSTCNSQKNASFLRLSNKLNRKQCVGLLGTYNPAIPLNHQPYRLVHPHFDQYSHHLCIYKGWVFKWHSKKGRRTVKHLKLNDLSEIERRLRRERLQSKAHTPVLLLIASIAETDRTKLPEIITDVIQILQAS